MARKSTKTYDVDYVRSATRGRWPDIIAATCSIDRDTLDGKHHPCPRCGGTDRFRAFNDFSESGGVLCNQCHDSKNGDGFATVQWLRNCKFQEAVKIVAEYLGVEPTAAPSAGGKAGKKPPKSYATLPEAITAIRNWMVRKRPERTIQSTATAWMYHDQSGREVMAVVRYNTSTGKEFCPFHIVDSRWLSGDPSGKLPLFNLPALTAADHVYICEGEKAAESGQEIGLVTTTASHGSKSPHKTDWSPLAGKRITVLRDNDDDGKKYAENVRGQLAALSPPPIVAVKLLPDLPPKGDLFDFVAAHQLEKSNEEIVTLIETVEIEPFDASQSAATTAIEHDDDPHRLARINLERYAATADGATIRYWRDEWYTWKPSRGCYRRIGKDELRAKIGAAIKEEFNRINVEKQGDPGSNDEIPYAQKVTKTLITNVLEATASMVLIPSSVEMGTWIDGQRRERRNYIAMANGILDLDRLLEDQDEDTIDDILLPHSPEWFSCIRLPYDFDEDATCGKWESFLQHNMAGDQELIAILQEWAGYCLLPDTGMQKFLLMEGEGSNGKSVYMAAITALLGQENVSNVPLEVFGDRFSRTDTIGKLANIAGDCEELDKVAEGYIKSFTSGDRMYFDRKGLSGINCVPTARMMISCNERPRLRDRSNGIWRRMALVPWRVVIQDAMKVRGMDKPWWWEASGELPGMLLWAIKGLHRLKLQGGFTDSEASNKARGDYQCEMNSAKAFLNEYIELISEPEERKSVFVRGDLLYEFYVRWAKSGGYYPFAKPTFAKEVFREFKGIQRKQKREPSFLNGKGDRHWVYLGLRFINEKIADIATDDTLSLIDAE